MATFTFRHGDPVMIDHTPAAGDVTAGDAVTFGNLTGFTMGVAHKDIANTELGAVSCGGGVYDVKFALNTSVGDKLHYDSSLLALTTNSTNNSQFGFAVEATTAVNTVAKAYHDPFVPI